MNTENCTGKHLIPLSKPPRFFERKEEREGKNKHLLYSHRTAGGDRDHCHIGGDADACAAEGA